MGILPTLGTSMELLLIAAASTITPLLLIMPHVDFFTASYEMMQAVIMITK